MDLLFINLLYFLSVYFSASPIIVVFVFVVCFILINETMHEQARARLRSTILCTCYFTSMIVVALLNKDGEDVYGAILDPFYGLYQVVVNGNVHFLRGMSSNIVLFIPFRVILHTYF